MSGDFEGATRITKIDGTTMLETVSTATGTDGQYEFELRGHKKGWF